MRGHPSWNEVYPHSHACLFSSCFVGCHPIVAFDLEHHSFSSYRGFTCLIQISTRDKDYLLDPFPIFEHLHLLNEVTANPGILKIFHGAESDIIWLQVSPRNTLQRTQLLLFVFCLLSSFLPSTFLFLSVSCSLLACLRLGGVQGRYQQHTNTQCGQKKGSVLGSSRLTVSRGPTHTGSFAKFGLAKKKRRLFVRCV